MQHSSPHFPDARPSFATTRWSRVVAAGRDDSVEAHAALAELCEAYWYPLYTLLRRRGHDAQDALDLTQGFFARLLEKRDLGGADAERGRFRAYLSGALLNYVRNARREERAAKRGGDAQVLSLDLEDAEGRYRLEAADTRTPERAYDRAWALVLIDRALAALGESYRASGKGELFDALRSTLTGDATRPYAELAAELGLKEGALKVAVHRLRKRFRAEL